MSLYGLSSDGAVIALTAVLPNGTDVYVGLITSFPVDRSGTGLVEASVAAYARVAHQDWLDDDDAGSNIRINDGAVSFAALGANLPGVVGFGIWDALTSGVLLAFGPLLDADDVQITRSFITGDQPEFADQTLKLRLGAA